MKFLDYLPSHEEIYPKPKKEKLGLGWEFSAAVVVSVAAIILASLRTAHSFYTAAILSASIYGLGAGGFTSVISLVEAAAAMLAIEGGIVFGAIKRSQQTGKVPPKLFIAYIVLLIVISIVAGLGQSLGLILGLADQVLANFTWAMAIVLGVGASIVAWLSGEMLGVEMLKYGEAKKANNKAFSGAEARWLNKARKEWFKVRSLPLDRADAHEVPAPSSDVVKVIHPKDKKNQTKKRVKAQLTKIAVEEGRVAPGGEIAEALELSGREANEALEALRVESLEESWD